MEFVQERYLSINPSYSLFDNDQRSALAVDTADVYFSFVYQIGILMEDHPTEENKSIRHAEITWVGQTFPDYMGVIEKCDGNPMEVKKYHSFFTMGFVPKCADTSP